MNRTLLIIAFLCATAFMPSIATAQNVYAKQKIAIWDIIDRNDRKFDPGLKGAMLQGFRDALVGSEDYEVYEINIDDIKSALTAKGQNHSFPNICKIIGERSDFILFTEIESSFSAFGAQSQNTKVTISCSLYRINTATKVASDQEPTTPHRDLVLSTASLLISRMLGIKMDFQPQRTYQQPSHSMQFNQQRQQYTTFPQSSAYSTPRKIVVWEIEDFCSRQLAQSIKNYMRTEIIKIVRNSNNYIIHDSDSSSFFYSVRDEVKRRGLSYTRENIARVLRESYGINYVVFTRTNILNLSSSEILSISMILFNSETRSTMAQVGFNLRPTIDVLERDFSENVRRLLK